MATLAQLLRGSCILDIPPGEALFDQATSSVFDPPKRRSTRILQAVPLLVARVDDIGRPLKEHTATLSINCHGCRYFSRHCVEKNAWLTLEIPRPPASSEPHRLRARVAWVQGSRRLRGLFQVGVEFERPGNVWSIANPPEDWQRFAPAGDSDPAALEREMKPLLALADTGTYYQLLGVSAVATRPQIKHNFYELARKFHPDRHMSRPEWIPLLERLTDALTLAYKTLADEKAREEYDRRLARSGAFTLGQTKTETQKSADECLQRARECLAVQNYPGSIVWLRKAVQLDPGSSNNHALLARSLAAVSQYRREAIEHFQKAVELDPLNAWAHFHFAQLYEAMKLPWRARPLYERVVELDPEHREARERLRQLTAEEKKKARVEPAFLDRLLGRRSK